MIKVYSTFHDPLDIYDYFKQNFGSIYMLIQKNHILIKFQNILHADDILKNHKQIIVKGLPLKIYSIDYNEIQNKKMSLQESFNEDINTLMEDTLTHMEIEGEKMTDQYHSLVEEKIILVNNIRTKMKKIGIIHQEKLNQIKDIFKDSGNCNQKISDFNRFFLKQLKRNKKTLLNPFNALINNIRQYNFNKIDEPIDLEINLYMSHSLPNVDKKQISSSKFIEKLIYANPQKNQMKRLYALNENDFITTNKSPIKGENKGFLRMYRKKQSAPKYSVQIQEGPYSLLCIDNFILTGDYSGFIHFIDIQNQNQIQYSNRLNNGLIFDMQRYPSAYRQSLNILTLLLGKDNDFRIQMFQIQKQLISDNVNSLSFHSRSQIQCQGVTMTMDVIGNEGMFVYGSEKNTYICGGFDNNYKSIIPHQHHVMKVKRFNNNNQKRIIEATVKKLYLTDINNRKIEKEFISVFDLNTVEKLNDNLAFLGGRNGEIGVVDWRNTKSLVWSPSIETNSHMGKISDILRIGDSVITCDSSGIICEWKNQII